MDLSFTSLGTLMDELRRKRETFLRAETILKLHELEVKHNYCLEYLRGDIDGKNDDLRLGMHLQRHPELYRRSEVLAGDLLEAKIAFEVANFNFEEAKLKLRFLELTGGQKLNLDNGELES